jgi:two-component system, NarL family, nitrate/nitrite response regulator NarL
VTLLRIVGGDHALLIRWAEAARACGLGTAILPAASLVERSATDGYCLWDLGPRPCMDLADAERALATSSGAGFVFLSARPDAHEGLRLLRAGARGYANRLASSAVLAAVLESVRDGELWAGRQVTDYLLARALEKPAPSAAEPGLLDRLSGREAEVATRVAAGASNKVIASDMAITERTVKAHLNSIFRKTGIRNRVQLALAVGAGSEPGSGRRQSSG